MKLMRVGSVVVLLTVSGCGLASLLPPSTTTIRLVNNGQYTVDGKLYYDNQQESIKDLVKLYGTEVHFTIPAGESQTIIKDCNEIQAVYIDNAKLQTGLLTPDDNTELIRDGTDFNCGDTITYTFSHTVILVDFSISTAITTPSFDQTGG